MLGISKSLRDAGYEVLLGSGQLQDPNKPSPEMWDGFPIYSLNERTAEHLPRALKQFAYFSMGKKTKEWLDTLSPRPAVVILYSGYSAYFRQLLPWCEKHGIPLVFDAVEWYDWANMPGGRLGPYGWNIELAMRYYAVRAKNIIAISSYLDKHFKERGCDTIIVRPTLDVLNTPVAEHEPNREKIRLVYAGRPGLKDLFDHMLEALLEVDPEGKRFEMKIAGITPERLLAFPTLKERGITTLPGFATVLGQLPHAEATALVQSADFTILVRPQKRFANAGFPTKVVESLSMGIPVICNYTSDLSEYLRDGHEAIICKDHYPPAIAEALRKVLELTPEQRAQMRVEARARAEKDFDYRNYSKPLDEFIKRIRARAAK
jgi:glycosyltransferase involved in cell wall biosynthesis